MNRDVRVLVVDDDVDVANGTTRVLAQAGYVVETAFTGEAGWQAAQDRVPDLVLLDRELPGIDGLEVCRRIKAAPALALTLVVLASSSYAGSEGQSHGLEGGADGYIARPIGNRELLARVAAYSRISRLTHALRAHAAELRAAGEAAVQAQAATLNLLEDAVAARQRAAEAAAAAATAEAQYRAMFISMSAGFCVVDVLFDDQDRPTDYRFLEINPAFEQQSGLRDAVGKRMRELHPTNEEHWFTIYGKVALTGEPVQFENYAAPLGRHFSVDAYRIGGSSSRQVGIVFRDITERKRVEEERTRFATMLEQSLNEIYVFDPVTLRFRFVNEGARRNTGYSLAELLDLTPVDLTPAYSEAAFRAMFEPLLSGQRQRLAFETVHRRRDGTTYPVEVHLQLMGEGRAFLAIVDDITERQRTEAAIARQLDELQRWQAVMLDREARVHQLKREVNELAVQLGAPVRYPSQAAHATDAGAPGAAPARPHDDR